MPGFGFFEKMFPSRSGTTSQEDFMRKLQQESAVAPAAQRERPVFATPGNMMLSQRIASQSTSTRSMASSIPTAIAQAQPGSSEESDEEDEDYDYEDDEDEEGEEEDEEDDFEEEGDEGE